MWLTLTLALAADRRSPVVVAVERATPSVVALDVEVPNQSPFAFLGSASPSQSKGSGVVIDADKGIVLTNAHVVAAATSIRAQTLEGIRYDATPLAIDRELDLAILQLDDAKGLVAIELADSNDLMLGETAIAIGNPWGLGLTVSTGVVSSVDRDVEITPGIHQSYIQTDAPINPGNSGGALVDINGRLIGINTAIRAAAEGIGFAIPANRAKKIAEDLISFGAVRAPWLGCQLTDISARQLVGTGLEHGVVRVSAVYPDGPAARAGI